MFDTHEKPKEIPKPERSQEDIDESNAILGSMYDFAPTQEIDTSESPDGLDIAPARPVDSERIEGAMSLEARVLIGDTRSERQQDLRGHLVHETNGDDPYVRAHDDDVRRQTQQVKDLIDSFGIDDVREENIEARKVALDVENSLEGRPTTENGHMSTEDMNTVRRTAVAAEVLESLQDGNAEVLNRLDDSTAARVIAYQQGVSEHGGASQTSNDDLEYLGRKIEESAAKPDSGEMIRYVDEDGRVHQVEKNNHDRNLAATWMDGNWNSGTEMDHATRDQVYYYLEIAREQVNFDDPKERERVMSKVAHMIANGRHDSDRTKMSVGSDW